MKPPPDWLIRGVHVYGGALLVGVGLSFYDPWVGLAGGGAILLWLGLKWVR